MLSCNSGDGGKISGWSEKWTFAWENRIKDAMKKLFLPFADLECLGYPWSWEKSHGVRIGFWLPEVS